MEGEGEEKRYTRLPSDSVSLCAENLGIQASQEVASSMVEDVSFRIRQLTDTASQFMRHAKRRRLMVEDVDRALKWSSVEPLYGHSTSEPPEIHSVHESGLFTLHDHDVRLPDIAFSAPLDNYPLPDPPSVQARWLAIEGVSLSKESEGTLDGSATVELKRTSNESHHKYVSLLLEAVSGDSEDMRKIALTDVQTNPSIANILPDLVQYMLETLSCWVQFTPSQLLRVLKLLLALFRNTNLFLDPYATGLFPLVKAIILTPTYLHSGEGFNHWHLRHTAAISLAEIVRKCGSPMNEYVPDLHSSFIQLLAHQEVPLPVLYGTVLTLCYMGGKSIAEVLFPRLDTVAGYVQSLLESALHAEQESALKVYETLLLASELLLTSDAQPHLRPEQLPSGTGAQLTGQFNSFFAPMEVDGRDITGMGGLVKDVPTLYDYLVDIFGERLSLRLAGHQEFKTPSLHEPQLNSNTTTVVSGQSNESNRASRPHPREDPILKFLSREGFKPVKPQRVRRLQPPQMHRGRRLGGFAIPLPQTVLPVQSNVLERRQTKKSLPVRTDISSLKGNSPSYKRSRAKSRSERVAPDISFSWL